ncbi:hypothetical protein [uncultured Thiohalocapsa sp.]|uniref:hypothetical protein n=1 Tax=uncultured Thiohalocapsa sp. TaxID=768990 RepID=UPI0025DFBFE6|nr:hypothetical protein [uncultured Thiohalocapsa sp.]
MDVLKVSGPHNIQDVDNAPRLPGLYAWYARFNVAEADWSAEFAGGDAAAQRNLLKALREHAWKFGRQAMPVQAHSNFSTVWNGTLREDPDAKWHAGTADNSTAGFDERLQASIDSDLSRRALVGLLDTGLPLFCSPLYLGKAAEQTLQQRLRQHAARYLRLWERYLEDRDLPERLANPKDFAERAIKLGFSPDDLSCFTLSVDIETLGGMEPDTLSALIAAAEWLFNRWTTPILGRQ